MNDTTGNPWIIDTAAVGAITADVVRIGKIRWVGATTAGHEARVKNAAGRVVWDGFANGANYDKTEDYGNGRSGTSGKGIDSTGIIVDKLDSGKLYIHYL